MHDIKFKCKDNETRQLDETIYYLQNIRKQNSIFILKSNKQFSTKLKK